MPRRSGAGTSHPALSATDRLPSEGGAPHGAGPGHDARLTHLPTARGLGDRHLSAPLTYLLAFAVYQAMALAPWWHLVAGGFGTSVATGSPDPAGDAWFLAWVPHALGAGENPFFTNAVFAPHGVNLLANTSVELVGLLLSPLTVTAGPLASFGVAVLVAPSLSALGAFALCRRYVAWTPAAFVGGLCYGFGAFLTTDLRFGHLDLTWLVLPPLVFLALDELLVRRRRSPVAVGAVLGVLVVAQFFVSTEVLAVTALTAAAGIVVAALARPRAVVPAVRASLPGLAVAAGIAVAALAYPFWVVVAGPGHIPGPVWPHIGQIGTSLAATVQPHAELAAVGFISGGNGSYLGVTLLVVLLVGGVALWRRSPALRMALALAAIAYLASLGYDLHAGRSSLHLPLPAALLGHVPLLDSVAPERFAAMVDLFAGVALAIVVDHVARAQSAARHEGLPALLRPVRGAPSADPSHARRARAPASAAAALGVAVAALVPVWLAAPWPYPTTALGHPAALRTPALPAAVAGTGSGAAVVVVYPDSHAATGDQMVWQAEDDFAFSLPDGYAIVPGADGHGVEDPPDNALWIVFAAATTGRLHLPLSPTSKVAVRRGLRAMGTDEVVVLPGARGSTSVRRALASALGPATRHVGGAAVWRLASPARSGR